MDENQTPSFDGKVFSDIFKAADLLEKMVGGSVTVSFMLSHRAEEKALAIRFNWTDDTRTELHVPESEVRTVGMIDVAKTAIRARRNALRSMESK